MGGRPPAFSVAFSRIGSKERELWAQRQGVRQRTGGPARIKPIPLKHKSVGKRPESTTQRHLIQSRRPKLWPSGSTIQQGKNSKLAVHSGRPSQYWKKQSIRQNGLKLIQTLRPGSMLTSKKRSVHQNHVYLTDSDIDTRFNVDQQEAQCPPDPRLPG